MNKFGCPVIGTADLPDGTESSIQNIPNMETLEALREVEEMKKDPSVGKSYTDVDQMMEELLA